jgi:hypothetical protein
MTSATQNIENEPEPARRVPTPRSTEAMDEKCDAHNTTTETLASGARFGRGDGRGVRR